MCIIRDDAESGIRRVLLHNPSQRHLRRGSHRVRLVQDNQLVCSHRTRGPGSRVHGEDLLRAGEGLDLFADDIDTAIIGGIELEDHLAHVLGAIDSARESEDSRCFSCSWRTVEKEMGKSLGFWSVLCCSIAGSTYVCVYELVDGG